MVAQKIEGLTGLARLERLFLGKNKIISLDGLQGLTNLRLLSIQVRVPAGALGRTCAGDDRRLRRDRAAAAGRCATE